MTVTPQTLTDIVDLEAGVAYPGHLLEGCETALVLFAAGFLGKQDAYWIADAGLTATCVDADAEKLLKMRAMYPPDWYWHVGDVYDYADYHAPTERWDVVSLDPWTMDFGKCAALIGTWCSLARRVVILGTGVNTKVLEPTGWKVSEVRQRSEYDGGVYWTCLEPA